MLFIQFGWLSALYENGQRNGHRNRQPVVVACLDMCESYTHQHIVVRKSQCTTTIYGQAAVSKTNPFTFNNGLVDVFSMHHVITEIVPTVFCPITWNRFSECLNFGRKKCQSTFRCVCACTPEQNVNEIWTTFARFIVGTVSVKSVRRCRRMWLCVCECYYFEFIDEGNNSPQ